MSALTIRELLTKYSFKADTKPIDGFRRAVDGAKKATKWGAAAAAGMATAVGALLVKTATYGDNIAKMSKRVGVGTDLLQGLKHAAELSGSSLEAMEAGFKRLTATAYSASEGTKTAVDAFDAIGVSIKNTDGSLKDMDQLLWDSMTGLSMVESVTERAALAQRLFGRAGMAMLPMLEGGSKGVAEMVAEAKRLGLVMGGDALKNSEEFSDNLLRLKRQVQGVALQVGSRLLPIVDDWLKKAQAWIDNNRELINQRLEQVLRGVVSAAKSLGQALGFVIDNWKVFAGLLAAFVAAKVAGPFLALGRAIWGIGGALRGLISKAPVAGGELTGLGTQADVATGKLGGIKKGLGNLAAAGAAFKIGWDVGTWVDELTGASDKVSDLWTALDRLARKPIGALHKQAEGITRVAEQAKAYADLLARGVTETTEVGGEKMALTPENIQKRLKSLAGKLGVAGQLTPEVLARIAPAQAGALQGARGSVTVESPQITVNVPPGTPEGLSRRVGEASGSASERALRQAAGNIARPSGPGGA